MARFADRFHRPGGFHDRAPCKKLKGNTDGHTLHCRADPMLLSADHAPPLGLLINELVTNAIKDAYPDGDGGEIKVSAREIEGHLEVEVSDEGIGLPDGFDLEKPSASLGFKVIAGMVRQMQGRRPPVVSPTLGGRNRDRRIGTPSGNEGPDRGGRTVSAAQIPEPYGITNHQPPQFRIAALR